MGKKVVHQMLFRGTQVDALTGEEWELFDCPQCGYQYKMQWKPYRKETLRIGEGTLTDDDAEELRALGKAPAGRAEVARRMASEPGHAYSGAPTEDQLREAARQQGRGEQFEASVDQAIIDGEPLMRFGFGGAVAETWPKGTGPVK